MQVSLEGSNIATKKVSDKILLVFVRPVYSTKEGHTKYGVVGEKELKTNNPKFEGRVRFKGREYRVAVQEPSYFNKKGLGIILYDVEGNRPLDVKIDDIPSQTESLFAEKVYGLGTLKNMFAGLQTGNKLPILMVVVFLVLGILGGIVIDHFAHI